MNLSLLLCLSAFCFAPLAYATDCGQSLDGAPQDLESEISPDDRAVRWLKDLLGSELKWPAQDAHAAVTRLLAGSRENPVSEGAVSNNPDLYVHRLGLAELMQEISDPVAVGRALQEELNRRDGSAQRREETREEVEVELYVRMNFGEIPPGTFSAKIHKTSYLINIVRPFWMLRTPATWWQLGEVLPRLRRDDRTANSPAGDLTYDEAQEFVDELNQWARTGDPRLLKVVPDHRPTWRYSLPDASEWMYVASHLAMNSSGVEAWQKNSGVSELTLGGFTSMDQAAPHYRGEADSVYRAVDELDPIIILGSEFYDLGGAIETWLRPDPWGPSNRRSWTGAPRSKAVLRIQTPGILPKELSWFTREVLGDNYYDNSVPISELKPINSKDAPILSIQNSRKSARRATLGIRLIAFEADAETDARLDSNTPVDEAATIARLGADFLTYRIQSIAETTYAASIFKERRTHMLQVVYAALKNWKQGQSNQEFENEFQSLSELMKIYQHPALNLPRFALEVEAQLEARGMVP